jgi:hypothetical protein
MRTSSLCICMFLIVSHSSHADSGVTCEARAGKPEPTQMQRSYEKNCTP